MTCLTQGLSRVIPVDQEALCPECCFSYVLGIVPLSSDKDRVCFVAAVQRHLVKGIGVQALGQQSPKPVSGCVTRVEDSS